MYTHRQIDKPPLKALKQVSIILHVAVNSGFKQAVLDECAICINVFMYVCMRLNAQVHAHAIFISTTTKPLPDSATNTDYDTLTLTAFTTTPICNLLQPETDVGLPCPLLASKCMHKYIHTYIRPAIVPMMIDSLCKSGFGFVITVFERLSAMGGAVRAEGGNVITYGIKTAGSMLLEEIVGGLQEGELFEAVQEVAPAEFPVTLAAIEDHDTHGAQEGDAQIIQVIPESESEAHRLSEAGEGLPLQAQDDHASSQLPGALNPHT